MPNELATPSKLSAKKSLIKRHSERSFCGGVQGLFLEGLIFTCTYPLPPLHSGTDTVHSADKGLTIKGGQDFPSFLGPMYAELHEKFGQWIKLTYSELF